MASSFNAPAFVPGGSVLGNRSRDSASEIEIEQNIEERQLAIKRAKPNEEQRLKGIAISWERMGMDGRLGGVCANLGNIANGLAGDAKRLTGCEEVAVLSDAIVGLRDNTGADCGLGQKEVRLPSVLKVIFAEDAGRMEDISDDCDMGVDDGVCKKKRNTIFVRINQNSRSELKKYPLHSSQQS
jgi:hypothetical protein